MENILIVEDDAHLSRLFARVLEKEGYSVQVAGDGDEAMHALDTSPPDVIVLDMNLPSVSGFEVIRYIRSQAELKHMRILVVSANSNVPSSEEAELADVVLMKPISLDQLKTMVSRMAGTR